MGLTSERGQEETERGEGGGPRLSGTESGGGTPSATLRLDTAERPAGTRAHGRKQGDGGAGGPASTGTGAAARRSGGDACPQGQGRGYSAPAGAPASTRGWLGEETTDSRGAPAGTRAKGQGGACEHRGSTGLGGGAPQAQGDTRDAAGGRRERKARKYKGVREVLHWEAELEEEHPQGHGSFKGRLRGHGHPGLRESWQGRRGARKDKGGPGQEQRGPASTRGPGRR